jgi:hypothetical protein
MNRFLPSKGLKVSSDICIHLTPSNKISTTISQNQSNNISLLEAMDWKDSLNTVNMNRTLDSDRVTSAAIL